MAAWPVLDDLKLALNVAGTEAWDDILSSVLAAAISYTKGTITGWDELTDEPDENESQAALRTAVLMSEHPEAVPGAAWQGLGADPAFMALIAGRRRSFAIS